MTVLIVTRGSWLRDVGDVPEKLPFVALKRGEDEDPTEEEVVTAEASLEEPGDVEVELA